jgi:hypothetical protein
MLIMQSVGGKWPAHVLVSLAEGQDREVAAQATRMLADRRQSHLLPATRDLEM